MTGFRQEKASLTVSFSAAFSRSGSTSRTVLPQADLGITSITVTVTHTGGSAVGSVASASETCSITGISPGAVSVQAVARNASSAQVASGTASATLAAGTVKPLTVTLSPGASGTGHFAFAMIWPESTGAAWVGCLLRKSNGSEVNSGNPPTPLTAGGGIYTWTYSDEDAGVASGAYDLAITFKSASGGTVLGAFVESVNVYDHLTSDTWLDGEGNHLSSRSFSPEEMKSSLCTLSRLTVSGAGFSNAYTASSAPPLNGDTLDLGRTASASIGFSAELIAPEAGQSIAWVLTDLSGPSTVSSGSVGSGEFSGQIALADGTAGNSLVITVSSPYGTPAVYTVIAVKAYPLSYESNGATGGNVPAGGLYYLIQTVTVSDNSGCLVRNGYSFAGWTTEAGGSGTLYAAGATFPMPATPVTLYAKWQKNGTVGVNFSLPAYHNLLFAYNGEAVRTLTVQAGCCESASDRFRGSRDG